MLRYLKSFRWVPAFCVVVYCVSVLAAVHAGEKQADDDQPADKDDKKAKAVTYVDDVKPIFRQKCFGCHNPDDKKGNLDLTSYTGVIEGGSSGEVITPGQPAFSYLFSLVTHESTPHMPPNQDDTIPKEMIATLEAWIKGGALEFKGDKPKKSNKPKVDLSLDAAPTERPAETPMPGRLPLEPVLHTERPGAVSGLATSPWAPLAAVAGQNQVLLYHTESLELLGVLPFPEGVPHVLKFSRNGGLLLAGGGRGAYQGRVVVWNVRTGERLFEVGDELDTVRAADINAQQTLIALGGPGGIVRVYSTEDGSLAYKIEKHTDWIHSLAFSPDGVLLATADRNGGLWIWEGFSGREFHGLDGHSQAITGLSWRLDSNVLASASEDGEVRLWEMRNGNNIKKWNAHGGGVLSVEYTRDGRLVTCGRDRTAKLWNGQGKQQQQFGGFDDIALRVTHCDETNRVIAGDWSGTIRVWDAKNGKEQGRITPNPLPLQARLQSAAEQLESRKKTLSEREKALQQAASRHQQAQKQLDEAAKRQKELQQQKQQAGKRISELEQKVKTLTTRRDKQAGQVKQFEKKDDAKDDLAKARKALKETKAALQQAQKSLESARKQQTEAGKKLGDLEKRLAKLKQAVAGAGKQRNEAKKAAEGARQAVEQARQAVERWRAEIDFANQSDQARADASGS